MSMWETIPVAVKAVEKFFDWRSKRERQYVSTGLAVGYYYNFLHPFCSAFVGDDFTLYSQIKDSKPPRFRSQGKFNLEDVRGRSSSRVVWMRRRSSDARTSWNPSARDFF